MVVPGGGGCYVVVPGGGGCHVVVPGGGCCHVVVPGGVVVMWWCLVVWLSCGGAWW